IRKCRAALQVSTREASTSGLWASWPVPRAFVMKVAAFVIASMVLMGCTPVMETRGYLPNPVVDSSIKVGTDTKTTILDRLGDPSTQATFNSEAWYYISSRQK